VRRRCARKADTDTHQGVGETDLPVRDVLFPEQQHRQEGQEAEHVTDEQREAGTFGGDELRRPRRDQDHHHGRGNDRQAGVERRVVEHVLQELLADEHRAHQRPEHDDAGAGGHPERGPRGDGQVVERIRGAPLPHDERHPGCQDDHREGQHQLRTVGHRRKVDGEDQGADQHDRQQATEVVDRLGLFVDMGGHEPDAHHERNRHQWQRHEEHRAPPEVLEQGASDQRPKAGDGAAGGRPQRDRLRAGLS